MAPGFISGEARAFPAAHQEVQNEEENKEKLTKKLRKQRKMGKYSGNLLSCTPMVVSLTTPLSFLYRLSG